jgi:hypothetical protein
MGVGTHRVNFHSHFLELRVFVRHISQFGRTHKGEVRRIKEEDGPLSPQLVLGDGFEGSFMECLGLEIRDFTIDQRVHVFSPWPQNM